METNSLGDWAKNWLVKLAKETDRRLEKYWDQEISKEFGFNESQKTLVKEMLLHAKEHNLRSAKRARASFVKAGFMLGSGEVDERIWKVMESIELVHTALLMHDDFMDKDVVRRGKSTTQVFFANGDQHYGESMAVNVGDAVLCLGFERLLNSGFGVERISEASAQMMRAIAQTAFGQAYDMSLPKLGELSEEKVLSLHRAKTAIYTYENPLMVGAILGGLSEEVRVLLREYSALAGIAFQLQDDVLGVFGDEEKTGKSSNSDILQGKVTMLIVKTLELGTEKEKESVLRVWGKFDAREEDIEKAKKAIKSSGSLQCSLDMARKLNMESIEVVKKIRGMVFNKEAVDYLEGISRYMVERET